MASSQILVLADDLTGALEMGGKFAALGVPSLVTTRHGSLPDWQPDSGTSTPSAIIIDTETRHLSPAEAAPRVSGLARAAHAAGFLLLYKKTDSTLRGNIGSELAAMIEAYGGAPLLYLPAYPRLGRTVRDGSLFVDGVPVAATHFGSDLLNPVEESHIPTLLAAQCELAIFTGTVASLVNRPRSGISVCDGELDADLAAAAEAFEGPDAFRLAAGTSALAGHLARLLNPPEGHCSPLPACNRVLVVNGSLHPASQQQIVRAKQNGIGYHDPRAIHDASTGNGWAILDELQPAQSTQEFAREMAAHVCRLMTHAAYDALVVFGGDTAFAIVAAMGNPPLHPIGEVMEGVPISKIDAVDTGTGKDLFLVTKAGGFGSPELIALLQSSLGESAHP